MADPETAESFSQWSFDPAAGAWRDPLTPDNPALSIRALSQGRYFESGSTIRDALSGRIVGNLSTVHGSTLSVGDQGSLFLNNGIGREDVNQAGGRSVMQRASITIRIPADERNPARELSGITSLTHFGGGIYTIMGAPSRISDYERVDLVPDQAMAAEPGRFALPREVGLYRRATPSEAISRSVAGWLARNAFDVIAQRVSGLGGKNYEAKAQAILDAIATLGITVEVNPFITYNLGGEE